MYRSEKHEEQLTIAKMMLDNAAERLKKPPWCIVISHDNLINYAAAALALHCMKVDWKWRNGTCEDNYEEVMKPLYYLREALESYMLKLAKRKTYRSAANVRQVIELYKKIEDRIILLEDNYSRKNDKNLT